MHTDLSLPNSSKNQIIIMLQYTHIPGVGVAVMETETVSNIAAVVAINSILMRSRVFVGVIVSSILKMMSTSYT